MEQVQSGGGTTFKLPEPIRQLVHARDQLRLHYVKSGLRFTLDGNLVGDLGEAVAKEFFGIDLRERCSEGIDGRAPDGRTVQIKASGTGRGPLFRHTSIRADHLVFMILNFENRSGEIVYNGPEAEIVRMLPATWTGQRGVSLARMRIYDALVSDENRLPMIGTRIGA